MLLFGYLSFGQTYMGKPIRNYICNQSGKTDDDYKLIFSLVSTSCEYTTLSC